MRRRVLVFLCVLALCACKKQSRSSTDDCFPDTSTARYVTNGSAVVSEVSGEFYLIEQGTIDTRLRPCNLPDDFKTNGLAVKISGEVKSTYQSGVGPCCTENFVITKISR